MIHGGSAHQLEGAPITEQLHGREPGSTRAGLRDRLTEERTGSTPEGPGLDRVRMICLPQAGACIRPSRDCEVGLTWCASNLEAAAPQLDVGGEADLSGGSGPG